MLPILNTYLKIQHSAVFDSATGGGVEMKFVQFSFTFLTHCYILEESGLLVYNEYALYVGGMASSHANKEICMWSRRYFEIISTLH